MDLRFNDEQQMWHDLLHRFMDQEVGREYTRDHDMRREFPEEIFQKMASQGWLGLMVPESEGGMAADPIMFAIFCEAIRRVQCFRILSSCSLKLRPVIAASQGGIITEN